jgi:hypothetical protein
MMKSRRMCWAGQVARKLDNSNGYRFIGAKARKRKTSRKKETSRKRKTYVSG